jgi:hypothetical protein
MTFDDLDARFPNGFVDAEITGVSLDYQTRTATIELNLRADAIGSPLTNEFRKAVLTIRAFYYFSVEAPDKEHLFYPLHSKIVVDGLSEDSNSFPLFRKLIEKVPANAFCCRFYVHDWNSFIHVAGPDAEFTYHER